MNRRHFPPFRRLSRPVGTWISTVTRWGRRRVHGPMGGPPVIGLALGGGFARGIAHAGVLEVLDQHQIPIRYIAGVSAGSVVASAYASGTNPEEIAQIGAKMRFSDIARWTINRLGLARSDRMVAFLRRLLKTYRFEEMKIPLAVVATDLASGEPAVFRDRGEVFTPVRASCSYPGLFLPVEHNGRYLVDGAISMDVPAIPLRQMGATRVISVVLEMPVLLPEPPNMLTVVNRCFQILQAASEPQWRRDSDLVIEPDVGGVAWDGFESAAVLIEAGRRAATAALPQIRSWLDRPPAAPLVQPGSAAPDVRPA